MIRPKLTQNEKGKISNLVESCQWDVPHSLGCEVFNLHLTNVGIMARLLLVLQLDREANETRYNTSYDLFCGDF